VLHHISKEGKDFQAHPDSGDFHHQQDVLQKQLKKTKEECAWKDTALDISAKQLRRVEEKNRALEMRLAEASTGTLKTEEAAVPKARHGHALRRGHAHSSTKRAEAEAALAAAEAEEAEEVEEERVEVGTPDTKYGGTLRRSRQQRTTRKEEAAMAKLPQLEALEDEILEEGVAAPKAGATLRALEKAEEARKAEETIVKEEEKPQADPGTPGTLSSRLSVYDRKAWARQIVRERQQRIIQGKK
jgi:hypothetical protein